MTGCINAWLDDKLKSPIITDFLKDLIVAKIQQYHLRLKGEMPLLKFMVMIINFSLKFVRWFTIFFWRFSTSLVVILSNSTYDDICKLWAKPSSLKLFLTNATPQQVSEPLGKLFIRCHMKNVFYILIHNFDKKTWIWVFIGPAWFLRSTKRWTQMRMHLKSPVKMLKYCKT